jgi:hypothetical protein
MKELDESQIAIQDFVDNAIYELIQRLNPSQKTIDWDIEMIADIREKIRYWLVERYKLTDEKTFYPYIAE